ncbi:MAG: hypothetical protein JW738_05395 [Actinobacteria bacterium]|nr:hypothetical protein [Actinomycetota bacterium]
MDDNGEKEINEFLEEFMNNLPDEAIEIFEKAVAGGMSEEELMREIFIGDCPKCSSKNVFSGDEIEDIDDATVGFCEDCGFIWCMECGFPLEHGEECGHWEVCEECGEDKDEYGFCGIETWECPYIMEWLDKQGIPLTINSCAWCGVEIDDDEEMYAVGAKMKEGVEITPCQGVGGKILPVMVAGRMVPAIVTDRDSEARRDGNDLIFMVCCYECATELKQSLEREREIIDRINMN